MNLYEVIVTQPLGPQERRAKSKQFFVMAENEEEIPAKIAASQSGAHWMGDNVVLSIRLQADGVIGRII